MTLASRLSIIAWAFLMMIFISTKTLFAEYPLKCQAQKDSVYYIIIPKPKNLNPPWPVKFFRYNTVTSKYEEAKDFTCDLKLPALTGTPDVILASCHAIFGPDGGENFSVKQDGKSGKIYAVYVPWGPTGVGEQTIMPCEEGVK